MEVRMKVLENASCLACQNAIWLIEINDLVHSTKAQHNLIEDWLGTSNETCVSSLWNNSKLSLVTVRKNRADFISCLGSQNKLWLAMILLSPIRIISLDSW
jgi:Na+-translocating ferredoxin:NAD+ oxidoreductase RNF subunit RnfB